jgi:general secretion pathway protein D
MTYSRFFGRFVRWAGLFFAALSLSVAEPGDPSPDSSATATTQFSLDQVDLRTFVKLVGDLTGRGFIVDETVQGKVTVITPKIPVREVYPLFLRVLESSGCAAVEGEGGTRIIPFQSRTASGFPIQENVSGATGWVTRVLSLKHVSAMEMRKLLESSSGGKPLPGVSALESVNCLVLTDTPENHRRLQQLIDQVDRPGAGVAFEVIPLKFLDAKDTAAQLTPILQPLERTANRGGGGASSATAVTPGNNLKLSLIPASQANALVVVGTPDAILELQKMLAKIDIDSPAGSGSLHAIFLKHLTADDAAKTLNALLSKQSADKDRAKGGVGTIALADRRIAIEPSLANNALLVDASPRDFEVVSKLVNELDQEPEQVVIEVVIAEKNMNNELDVGVDFAAINVPSKVGDTVVQGSSTLSDGPESLLNAIQSGVFPGGLTFGLARGTRLDADGNMVVGYPAVLNINARDTKQQFKILSCVPLIAQNNQEATVSVVNNIPILKSTIQGGTGSSRDIIQNIDRIDVGIKLKLTPHINPDRQVRMILNPSIEAIIDEGSSSLQFTPTIAKREVTTTVTVPDGETVIISGLMREDQTKMIRKVPILGDIPLLGFFFRRTVNGKQKTNLLIFVTPRVMKGSTSSQMLSAEWQKRTGLSPTNDMEAPPAPPRSMK